MPQCILYTAPGQTRIKQVSFKQVTYSFRNPMQSWKNEWTSLLIRLQLQCAGDDGLLISKKWACNCFSTLFLWIVQSKLRLNRATWPLFYSIALDPLYPSQCLWETFGYATGGGFNGEVEGLSPLRLSGQLNSMGCSVTFHQGESVSMVKLIEQVRCTQALVYPISLRVMLHL